MKRILTLLISITVLILLGIAFGLGGLPAGYVPSSDVYSHQIGNYYAICWVYLQNYTMLRGALMNQGIFWLLCVSSFGALVALIPFKKVKWLDLVLGCFLLLDGILTFFVPTFFLLGSAQAGNLGLGGGLVAMAILIICAGVLELCKALLLFREKEAE